MAASLDELRTVLVETWGVLTRQDWDALALRRKTVSGVLDKLAATTRFQRAGESLPYLTPSLRKAITDNKIDDPVTELGGRRWLRLVELTPGGQGAVWVACPCEPGRDPATLVALKEPRTPAAAPALRSEIGALLQVGPCEHIAPLVAYDRVSGRLATRLVNGPNLEELCQPPRVRLSYAEVVRIGIDACAALAAVHACGLIHKDLKPANVVLDESGRAVLIDFGLAVDPRSSGPRAGGTPYYIAPEVLQAQSAPDLRADIFSLSATLYRLLAGQPPHFHQCIHPGRYRSSGAVLDLRRFLFVDGSFDCDLEDLRRDVPRRLSRLIREGLSTDQARRPSDTAAFRAELEQVREQFHLMGAIEEQWRELSEVLLEAFRQVHIDDMLAGQVWVNATSICDRLEGMADDFPAVFRLHTDPAAWVDYGPILAVLPQTLKIPLRVRVTGSQLRELLNAFPDQTDRVAGTTATQLLTDLLVRTLEEVRRISFDALAVAHEWRTVLTQYGLA